MQGHRTSGPMRDATAAAVASTPNALTSRERDCSMRGAYNGAPAIPLCTRRRFGAGCVGAAQARGLSAQAFAPPQGLVRAWMMRRAMGGRAAP